MAKRQQEGIKDLPGVPGALVIIGTVERSWFEGNGEVCDKTGQGRFEITSDVLEQFIGQKVEITIKPLGDRP